MIETKAVGPSARGSGRRSNFSISGKLMSTCGWPDSRRAAHQLRQPVQGLRAEHQVDVGRALDDGRAFLRRHAAADADDAPAARPASGAFQRPSWLNTFSCAFSRIEQVLIRITSASSAFVVSSRPSAAASTSAIRAESYSFIWQPWVWMNSFFAPGRAVRRGGRRRAAGAGRSWRASGARRVIRAGEGEGNSTGQLDAA